MSLSIPMVGIAGLGSVASLYLAAAGVERPGIVERYMVGIGDLQRRIIYSWQEVGRPEAIVAANYERDR